MSQYRLRLGGKRSFETYQWTELWTTAAIMWNQAELVHTSVTVRQL